MADPNLLQATGWQTPDPALAEALRAYGFEATPPPIDDDPEPLPMARSVADLLGTPAAQPRPEPAFDPVPGRGAGGEATWWVDPESEPEAVVASPSIVPSASPAPAPVPLAPAVAPRIAAAPAAPASPAAATGPTPPAFLAGRIARSAPAGAAPSADATAGLEELAAFAAAAPVAPRIAAAPEEPDVPLPDKMPPEPDAPDLREASEVTNVAAGDADLRATIEWPEPQPLNDEHWRDLQAAPPVVDGPTLEAQDAAPGLAFDSPDQPGMDAPAAAPDADLEALRLAATAWFATDAIQDAGPEPAIEVDADADAPAWTDAGTTSAALDAPAPWGSDTPEIPVVMTDPWADAPVDGQARSAPDTLTPELDGSTEGSGVPDLAGDLVQAGQTTAAPDPWADLPPTAVLPTDAWADVAPAAADPDPSWGSPATDASLTAALPSPEPAEVAPPSVPAVEFLGYQDEPASTPPADAPPVVAPAPAPRLNEPPKGRIQDIGRRPPGAVPAATTVAVSPAAPAPATAAAPDPATAAAQASAAAPALPVAAASGDASVSAPIPSPAAERVAAPDPATAAGVTAAATGGDLWDLVTGPTPAAAAATAPRKASRLTTIVLTLLVVLVIVALVLGFLWSFTDLLGA